MQARKRGRTVRVEDKSGTSTLAQSARQARIRWRVAYTLVRNPCLAQMRRHRPPHPAAGPDSTLALNSCDDGVAVQAMSTLVARPRPTTVQASVWTLAVPAHTNLNLDSSVRGPVRIAENGAVRVRSNETSV